MLKNTPFVDLQRNYAKPEMVRLYMFAFELCLTNGAIGMVKNFIEFQTKFVNRFQI